MIKLHLGCGTMRREGMVNCDLYPSESVDVAFDVQEPWPFKDNTVIGIFSCHMLEHLNEPMEFFKEAWRVLAPNGQITLQLPYGASDEAISDLTHKRYWLPGSFCALQPGYGEAIGNPQHDAWAYPFSVDYVSTRIHKDLLWLAFRPWRTLGIKLLRFLWGGFVEMFVGLTALKTQDQLETFASFRKGNIVPVSRVAWMHDWNMKYRGPTALKEFSSGACENTAGKDGM